MPCVYFFFRYLVAMSLFGLPSCLSKEEKLAIANILHRPIREALMYPDKSTMGVRR